MDGGLLSLKWNNHRSTLFYMLSTVRKKECYTDVTLACDGKFYSVHKLVLSMCSEYFEQMFEQTQCKHPVIVLKDIKSEELESLLSYMYVGEVNVVQEKLSGLIKAAECLKIKGLAVPDEEPCSKSSAGREKRSSDNSLNSEPKRRRQDDSGNASSFRQAHSNRNDDRRKSLDHQSSSTSNKYRNTNSSNSNVNSTRPSSGDRESGERGATSLRADRRASPASNNQQQSAVEVKAEELAETSETEAVEEVMIEEPSQAVKEEPTDADAVYLSDSNSVPDHKDEVLMDSFSDAGQQQHFMDELLGHASESNQGNMGVGDYSEGGEGSSGGGGQQQQHMVGMSAEGSYSTTLLPLPLLPSWPTSLTASVSPRTVHGNSFLLPSDSNQMHCKRRIASSAASASSDDLDQHYQLIVAATSSSPQSGPGTAPLSHEDVGVLVSSMDYIKSIQANEAESGVVPMFFELDLGSLRCSDGRGIACPLCVRLFRDKFNFRDHYMSHSGEKPLPCHLCPYRCVRKRELERHCMAKHSCAPQACLAVEGNSV